MIHILISLSIYLLHPFHVSVCEITFNKESGGLEISQRIFIDDLETTLNNKYDQQLDLLNPTDRPLLRKLLNNYLTASIQISINEKLMEFQFLGYELEEVGIWCYLEIQKIEKIDRLTINNEILMEEFDDQSNIIHFFDIEGVRSYRLTSSQRSQIFEIKQ